MQRVCALCRAVDVVADASAVFYAVRFEPRDNVAGQCALLDEVSLACRLLDDARAHDAVRVPLDDSVDHALGRG